MSNSLGQAFVVTSFGESHGVAIGVVVDGCPPGLVLSAADIEEQLARRHPQVTGATSRREPDRVEILSGVFHGHTTGAPLTMLVKNCDIDSRPYDKNPSLPRPGHADYTAFVKYHGNNDYRGGGRFSGRITAGFVMAGAVARKIIAGIGIDIVAHTVQIGAVCAAPCSSPADVQAIRRLAGQNSLACVDADAAVRMLALLEQVKAQGDSVGGAIEGIAGNVPAGLGEPVFDTVEGIIAKALFAIPAVTGVAFGDGFAAAAQCGSQHNDAFVVERDRIVTTTNHCGGILGGITTGMPLVVRAAIKPTPSIPRPQQTVDLNSRENTTLVVAGRHDCCIVPRAVVVVEAMLAITLCDLALLAGFVHR